MKCKAFDRSGPTEGIYLNEYILYYEAHANNFMINTKINVQWYTRVSDHVQVIYLSSLLTIEAIANDRYIYWGSK